MTDTTDPTTLTAPRPLALVTGASSGIGLELARELAEAGHDLVVAAEDAGLEIAAEGLREAGGAVQPVRVDLRSAAGVDELWAAVRGTGRDLDVAAVNAGVGVGGPFLETDVEAEVALVDLNVTSTVRLTKLVLRTMAARGTGRVLLTSSVVADVPGTYQAVYGASKAFVLSFAEALQEELRGSDVTITALLPGPTDTAFFERAGMLDTPVGRAAKDDPADVAAQGVAALLAGRSKVVAGSVASKAQGLAGRVLPDALLAKVHRAVAQPDDRREA
ncbi:SDR family NAD(P)-dependent oxidoreductase [Jannaschia sp. R86511]|uniref:SDR family NAD(P)-dependent oxidoreductase n=1 Tax=Jannaschia sp. R86511 TaxID=3093853 RepID=UPI0036D32F04